MSSKQSFPRRAYKDLKLPITRVRTIMKSSPNIEAISQDCLYLMTKGTEMFVKHWIELAYVKSNKAKMLEYKHVAEVVQTNERFEFMRLVVPKKITYKQFKEMMIGVEESESESDEESMVELLANRMEKSRVEEAGSSGSSQSKNSNDSFEKSSSSESE